MITEEQLLQEARIEAEKAIPNGTYNIDCFDECVSEIAREGFEEGYIANAKKQMSEAAAFSLWQTTREGVDARTDLIYDSAKRGLPFHEELFKLFKQQKQE